MLGPERNYTTARGVFSVLEIAGWGTVVIGVLIALWGLTSTNMSPYDPGGSVLRVVGVAAGGGLALAGLLAVALVQTSRASVDAAEILGMLLVIARGQVHGEKSLTTDAHGFFIGPSPTLAGAAESVEVASDMLAGSKVDEISPGSSVVHIQFRRGTVISIDPVGVTVDFEQFGIKIVARRTIELAPDIGPSWSGRYRRS